MISIKNCANCFKSLAYGECGVNNRYVCEKYEQKDGLPITTIIFAETENDDENFKIATKVSKEACQAGFIPLSPYLNTIKSKEWRKKITEGMIYVSKSVLVFGSMDQSLETYLDFAVEFGIPVYFLETETCLPDNPAMQVVLKAVREAIESHKGDESICLLVDSRKEKAVLQFEFGKYRSEQILSTENFQRKDYLFLERYIYRNNINCEICGIEGQYADFIFDQIEPKYEENPY